MRQKSGKKAKKKSDKLKIEGNFNDVLKVAVSDNPKPTKKPKRKS